ncbi:LysR family transcriptional regulator [Bradyrhizobium sp. CCBAU 53340]|uniref:LysR family transcriptional regulator n=1 Tax=Bradyrhizobium sp. CCBAU 53340 TaxID=1325112 RepID=UPI001889FBAB|nr:LysR family transcriptional regulator [Bradyrhizobium sp. CCBAU 53340]QOZ47205.1 LysR family transcriptional regulator [Bradyrhizobium sp. CCBAU 53340]
MSAKRENWDARIGRRIRLRDVHVFLTVAQCGSMARAAQQLSVTQPAISKSVADLEFALGVKLLDRGPQGVAPTDYGKAFERRGLAVFDELRQGVSEIEFLADPRIGEVRLGCPDTLAATLLPPVLERLSAQHPGIRLHIEQTNPVLPDVRQLLDRSVDLMFGRLGPPFGEEVHSEILYRDPMVVVAPVQSKWARRRKVALADLVDERWILYPPDRTPGIFIEQAFREQGLSFPHAIVLGYSLQLRDMLMMTGDYLTIVAASAVPVLNAKRDTVRILPIDLGRNATARPVTIVTLKKRTPSPVVDVFIGCVRAVAKEIKTQIGR